MTICDNSIPKLLSKMITKVLGTSGYMTTCNNSIPKLLSKMITKVLGTDKYRNLVLVLFVNGLGRLRSNRVSWTLQGPFKILDAFGFVLSADTRSTRFLTECSVLCYPMGDISTPCGKFVRPNAMLAWGKHRESICSFWICCSAKDDVAKGDVVPIQSESELSFQLQFGCQATRR